MHELSICQALIDQVAHIASQHQAQGVKSIVLKIGPLSGVEPEHLRSIFPFVCTDTIAAGATLKIEATSLRVVCKTCQAETSAHINCLVCGRCGDLDTQLISGDECLLESVELID